MPSSSSGTWGRRGEVRCKGKWGWWWSALATNIGSPRARPFFVGQTDGCWVGSRCRPGHPPTWLRRSAFRADPTCSVCRARDVHGAHPKNEPGLALGPVLRGGSSPRRRRGGAWPSRHGAAAATDTRAARAAYEEYSGLKGSVVPHRPHGDHHHLDGSGNAPGVFRMIESVCRCKTDKQDTG